MQKNKASLGLFDVTMIVVSLVIGMGIFRTPVNVAGQVPDTFTFFLAWIVGGLVAFCGALTYAEIGARLPVTGGYYRVFSYAYHPSIAFAINCIILVSNAASLAGIALIGAEYISTVLFPHLTDAGALQTRQVAIALFSILVFYGVNLLGLKMSARTLNVLTIIKITLILLLVTPLFFASDAPRVDLVSHKLNGGWRAYIEGFGTALVAISFTYGGYQQTINFGADVKKPDRNIPKGIFAGIAIIILLYLSINYAYVKVIGFDQLGTTRGVASVMAAHVFGPAAGKVLAVLLFLSVLAYVNVLLMSNPRVMFAMSEDGVIPRLFMRKKGDTDVLITSLTTFTVTCMVIVFFGKAFDRILNFTLFLDCFGMALSAATVFILRKKKVQPLGNDGYRMKLYPLLPVIFIINYVLMAISIMVTQTATGLTALAVLAGFMIIYFVTRKKTTI